MATGQFKLSASLRGHEEDVRTVVFPNRLTIFSASRDSTVRTWTRTSSSDPPLYDDTIAIQGSHWFNGLAYAPPNKAYPDGLIAAGGRETFLYVKQPGRPPEEDPERLLIGHAHNICCVDFSEDGSKIVSGAWDSQAFIWNVEDGAVIAELQGHGGNVWGVLFYDSNYVLTACADKMIRIFDVNGKSLKTLQGHTDVVRALLRLPQGHWSGAAFASAGNDQIIRLWTMDGTSMGELYGHTEYIYSLSLLPNGDIVSSGEDRSVRIWRDGECIQTIIHPALSIWSVAVCQETGDIVSGASDKIVRIFSRSSDRQADAESLSSFDDLVRSYAIPTETANQAQPFNPEKLPGPEVLQTQQGTKDGAQLFVREQDGSVTAHMWSMSSQAWNLIGTVVSGQGSGSDKKTHGGKQYDYVFDIDIEEGKPALKLPYNLKDNPWDVARKFLEDNELPISYLDQVANWITENTKSARIGQSSQVPNQQTAQARDPWGTERRYRPGDAGASGYGGKKIPQSQYLQILEGNAANAISKIVDAQEASQFDEADLTGLEKLSSQLQNTKEPQPQASQIATLLKVVNTWPNKARVAAVAVLARLAVSPSFVNVTSSGNGTVVDLLSSAGLLAPKQETPNNAVHTVRLLANLFATDPGRLVADGCFDEILRLVRPFASAAESPPQARALATLYLNYAVLLTSNAPSKESSSRESRAEILIIDVGTLLESIDDNDAVYRTLAALGTLLALGDAFRQSMKGGVAGTLSFVAMKAAGQLPQTKELIQEIRDELR